MTAINTAKGDKTLTYTTVEDTAANLATDAATNSGEGTFTQDKVVTLTDEASIAELTAINAAKGDKTLTYTTVKTPSPTCKPMPPPTVVKAPSPRTKLSPSLMRHLSLS